MRLFVVGEGREHAGGGVLSLLDLSKSIRVFCQSLKAFLSLCMLVKVICNGEEVLTVSGTKEKYVVDVWSGNHPFFQVLRHCAPWIKLKSRAWA